MFDDLPRDASGVYLIINTANSRRYYGSSMEEKTPNAHA